MPYLFSLFNYQALPKNKTVFQMQYIFLMKISSIFYQPTITQRILKIYITLTHMHPLINLSCEKSFFDIIIPRIRLNLLLRRKYMIRKFGITESLSTLSRHGLVGLILCCFINDRAITSFQRLSKLLFCK